MTTADLTEWIEGGTSVAVATADADRAPSACRAIALTTRDNFETVTVYIPSVSAGETIANVATTRRVAISCSKPLSHRTIQIKGICRGVRLAPPSEEELVRTRLHQFADVLAEIGVPRGVTHRIAHWPAFAVDVSVEEVFDQTPGPRAGQAIA